jgi:hypothetical protein
MSKFKAARSFVSGRRSWTFGFIEHPLPDCSRCVVGLVFYADNSKLFLQSDAEGARGLRTRSPVRNQSLNLLIIFMRGQHFLGRGGESKSSDLSADLRESTSFFNCLFLASSMNQ